MRRAAAPHAADVEETGACYEEDVWEALLLTIIGEAFPGAEKINGLFVADRNELNAPGEGKPQGAVKV